MPTLLPWASAEVGDLDIFAPAVPCLFVYTWYVDGEPDSTVSYFWQDEGTGIIHHELLFNAPVPYEEAMDWAQAHASTSNIERIHVRHARPATASRRRQKKVRRPARVVRTSSRKRSSAKQKVVKGAKTKRASSRKKASKR
jgi:hypothetical protein